MVYMGKNKETYILVVVIALVMLCMIIGWTSAHLTVSYYSGSSHGFRYYPIRLNVLGSDPDNHVYGTHVEIGHIHINYLHNKGKDARFASEEDH